MSIIAETSESRASVGSWTGQYLALRAQHGDHPFDAPAWPAAATPSWVTEVEVGPEIGGEVTIDFASQFEQATIVAAVAVVVDDSPELDENHPGARVSDLVGNDGVAAISILTDASGLSADAASKLFDSLAPAIVKLRQIEASGLIDSPLSS